MEKSKIKNQKSKILLCFLVGVYCASCTLSTNKLPNALGNVGEVLVVINDYLWKGTCGDSIRHYLTEPVIGLPAPEPMFVLMQQNELNSYMQKFRNVLIVNIDPGYEKSMLSYKSDQYAKFQLIFNLYAPSVDSLITYLYRNKDLIVGGFLMKARDATIEDYKRAIAQPIVDHLREKYQVDIIIPNPYTLDVEKENFVWIAREEGERNWGILMWKEPYTSTDQLNPDNLIAKMNAMTRNHVSGKRTGSYMADEPLFPPVVKRYEKNGVYTVQMNGLWQMENDFLGGPYVNHTIVDIKRNQLVTAHGFIFYPMREKRQMVRQLEAILHTMMPTEE